MISETTPQLMIPPPFRFICKVPRKIVAQIVNDFAVIESEYGPLGFV